MHYIHCRIKKSESVEENVHAKLQLMFTVITPRSLRQLRQNFKRSTPIATNYIC